MNQEEIHALFLKFAAPLAFYIRLGGRKEAIETIAKMLWGALLGGAAVEERVWGELRQSADVEPGLVESLQACYYDEMKPLVSESDLAELRRQYGIATEE
jgi:hypothetical protein